MASIGAIFTSTYCTKQLNPWPNSSASCVVNYSRLSACQGDIRPFEGDPNTRGHLTSLRNKPQQEQPRQLSAPILAWIVSQCIQLSFDGKKCVLLLCWWKASFLKSGHIYLLSSNSVEYTFAKLCCILNNKQALKSKLSNIWLLFCQWVHFCNKVDDNTIDLRKINLKRSLLFMYSCMYIHKLSVSHILIVAFAHIIIKSSILLKLCKVYQGYHKVITFSTRCTYPCRVVTHSLALWLWKIFHILVGLWHTVLHYGCERFSRYKLNFILQINAKVVGRAITKTS